MAASGEIPRGRLARELRNALRLGPKSGNEPELPGMDTPRRSLRHRGYHVAMKASGGTSPWTGALGPEDPGADRA
jgi:hypothetical protein